MKYECESGYGITGLVGGKMIFRVIFEIGCNADEIFDDPRSGNPVQCGVPPPIPTGIRPGEVMYYPTINNDLCKIDFAVGGVADATSSTIECDKDGNLQGVVSCEPASCGATHAGENAMPVQPDRKYTYIESVAYSCKPGFSTDGLPTGTKNFEKICGATGGYILTDPSECMNIDYYTGNLCGFNGDCTLVMIAVKATGAYESCGCETVMKHSLARKQKMSPIQHFLNQCSTTTRLCTL